MGWGDGEKEVIEVGVQGFGRGGWEIDEWINGKK